MAEKVDNLNDAGNIIFFITI